MDNSVIEEKCVPKRITFPLTWLAAFERAAQRNHQSFSEWVGECCKDKLPKKVQQQLPERPGRGRRWIQRLEEKRPKNG